MSKRTTTDQEAMLAFLEDDSVQIEGEASVVPAIAHGAKDPKILSGQLNKAMSHNETLQCLVEQQKKALEANSQNNLIKEHKSRFRPDPDQYRKTITQDMIDRRRGQMEEHGQLSPIIVAPLMTDEKGETFYPIINGHCRYVAFMQSEILQDIEAKIHTDEIENEGEKIIIQMLLNDEGSESVKILERAEGYKLAADLFGSQQAVADKLGIDKGRISAVMSLLKLPENIQAVSKRYDINDAKVLKGIEKVQSHNEETAKELMDELKANLNDATGTKPSARDTVNKYLAQLPKAKNNRKKDGSKKENKKTKLPMLDSVNVSISSTSTKLVLNVELKKKIARFNITNEMLDALIKQRESMNETSV